MYPIFLGFLPAFIKPLLVHGIIVIHRVHPLLTGVLLPSIVSICKTLSLYYTSLYSAYM